jgi:hypothetical protein
LNQEEIVGKLLIILAVNICLFATAGAFQVVSTTPPAGSESFDVMDTLTIIFNSPPDPLPTGAIVIQGAYSTYDVGHSDIRGDTLRITPHTFWLAGDKVTVILTPALTSFGASIEPYMFQFSVRVPAGKIDTWSIAFELDYDQYENCGIPMALVASDFNGDGPIDLAIVCDKVTNDPSTVGVAQNTTYTGEGLASGGYAFIRNHFSWSDNNLPPSDVTGKRELRAADLDRDGRPDLVVSEYWNETLTIYRNNSDSAAIDFGTSPETVIHIGDFYGVNLLQDFRIVDFNSDGLPDIVAIFYGSQDLIVLKNAGNFSFSPELHLSDIGSGPSMMAIADFNLDRRLDIAICYQGDPKVDVFWNETGSASSPIALTQETVNTSLPHGADGVLADNIYGYWDPSNQQYSDLAVWSRGGVENSGNPPLSTDDVGFLKRIRNSNGQNFSVMQDGPPFSQVPYNVILADIDSTSIGNQADKNWIVSTRAPGENPNIAGIYLFRDNIAQSYQTALTSNIDLPAGLTSFDCDLDGDIDLFLIERDPDNEKVLYFVNPACQSNHLPPDTLDFSRRFINGGTNPFGRIPMDTTVVDTFQFVNAGVYPIYIIQMTMVGNPSGVFANLFNPSYPVRVDPGQSADIRFSFTPKDSARYAGTTTFQVAGAGQCSIQSFNLTLLGRGGRSIIRAVSQNVDFGYMLAGTTDTASFGLANYGNYVLDARFVTDYLGSMTFQGGAIDSIAPGESANYEVVLNVPPATHDSTIIDRMMIYDGRFWNDDPLGYPLHLHTADTAWVTFHAEVIAENLKPVFTFPRNSILEDHTYIDTITVYDPNNPSQPVWYDTTGITSANPALRIVTILPAPGSYCNNEIVLLYTADIFHGVSAETVNIGFRARDNQFPTIITDTSWVLTVQPVDDQPWLEFVSGDTSRMEWESIDFDIAAYDEEFSPLAWGSSWTGPPGATVSSVVPDPSQTMKFHFHWATDQYDAGLYYLQLWISETANPLYRDTITVTVTVEDVPPDLRARSLGASSTSIRKNQTVHLSFSISEGGSASVLNPFRVTLYDNFYGNRVRRIWSHVYPSLEIGDRIDCDADSVTWSTADPGKHALELYVDPMSNADGNLQNNSRTLRIEVLYDPFEAHPLPFTPNKDGYNDSLYFDFGDDVFIAPKITIFTIDGRLVTSLDEVTDNAIVWLGRDNRGNECIPGAYLYILQDSGTKITSGLIYLAR